MRARGGVTSSGNRDELCWRLFHLPGTGVITKYIIHTNYGINVCCLLLIHEQVVLIVARCVIPERTKLEPKKGSDFSIYK